MAAGAVPRPGSDKPFYSVLAVVAIITIGSLGLGLWRGSQRTDYVNKETDRLQSLIPRGEPTPYQKDVYAKIESDRNREEGNQQNVVTILMAVFQSGTGAFVGLLAGKFTGN